MGSPCELMLYGKNRITVKKAAKSTMADIKRLEKRYSRYLDDSITASINRAAAIGGSLTVDAETARLLDYAQTCYEQSDGLFDITSGIYRKAWNFSSNQLPDQKYLETLSRSCGWQYVYWCEPNLKFERSGMELDFGGIGKEYATDRAVCICQEQGIRHGLIDLGGDIGIIGPHPDGSPWRVGIQHPRQNGTLMASIKIHRGGIATSGDYHRYMEIEGKRYCHILNPYTGWPIEGLWSVTVTSDKCLISGTASTIAMLKGCNGKDWLEGSGFHTLWMDNGGKTGGNIEKIE